MKKYHILTVVLGLLILTASAGRADTIQAFLDNPSDETGVAGIGTIRGWAFATNEAPVSVYLRVDGTTQHDYSLPCCGPREDVQQGVAGAPLNTSYSGVVNYARLGAGEHTVGVEIQAEGCEPVILEHTVTVAVPGNIEFNEAFSFEESWTGVDVHNDQILIVNATTGAGIRGETCESSNECLSTKGVPWSPYPRGTANLRVDYALPTQNTGIVEAYNEDATTGATLDAVQAIFNARCLPCHSSDSEEGHPVANLDLAAGHMPRNTIAARSGQLSDGTLLINPGRPDESYLVQKIAMDAPTRGRRMPRGMPPLSDEEMETIRSWVLGGALVPSDFVGHDGDDDHDHGTDHDDDHGHGLAETAWQLVALGTADAPDSVVGEVDVQFSATTLKGWTGCNRYAARYRVRGHALQLADLTATEAGCPTQRLFDQEQRVKTLWVNVERFEVSGDRLTLQSAEGQVLVFERVEE